MQARRLICPKFAKSSDWLWMTNLSKGFGLDDTEPLTEKPFELAILNGRGTLVFGDAIEAEVDMKNSAVQIAKRIKFFDIFEVVCGDDGSGFLEINKNPKITFKDSQKSYIVNGFRMFRKFSFQKGDDGTWKFTKDSNSALPDQEYGSKVNGKDSFSFRKLENRFIEISMGFTVHEGPFEGRHEIIFATNLTFFWTIKSKNRQLWINLARNFCIEIQLLDYRNILRGKIFPEGLCFLSETNRLSSAVDLDSFAKRYNQKNDRGLFWEEGLQKGYLSSIYVPQIRKVDDFCIRLGIDIQSENLNERRISEDLVQSAKCLNHIKGQLGHRNLINAFLSTFIVEKRENDIFHHKWIEKTFTKLVLREEEWAMLLVPRHFEKRKSDSNSLIDWTTHSFDSIEHQLSD